MKTFLIALLTIAAFSTVNAYNYPIGIPAAWIDPAVAQAPRPASWESEVAGHYYVDNTHPQATNTNNTYGYPAKPLSSIPTTYAAGSRIEVHGGPYLGGQWNITFNGTKENPCWFIGVEHPIIRRETILKGSYIGFDGFKFDTSRCGLQLRIHNSSNLHHILVRNCILEGMGIASGATSAIAMYGASGNVFHNMIFYKNTIHDLGDDEYRVDGVLTENDYHAFGVFPYVADIWILENAAYNMGGDGVQAGAYGLTDDNCPTRIYIGKNNFYHNLENAIDIKYVKDIVISQNYCYNFVTEDTLGGVAIVIHYDGHGIWCLSNLVHTAGYGIQTTGSADTWFIGNVIYDVTAEGMHFRASTSSGGCLYNTLYNYNRGLNLNNGTVSYLVKGNIFAGRAAGSGYDVSMATTGVADVTTLDYNFYTDMCVSYKGANYTSPSAMFTASGQEAHGVENSAVNFTNPATYDFSLGRDSPSVDAGPIADTSACYAAFQARFGIDIRRDFRGVTRPAGRAWDIGAYEYSETISPPGPPKVAPLKGQ